MFYTKKYYAERKRQNPSPHPKKKVLLYKIICTKFSEMQMNLQWYKAGQ